MSAFTNKQRRSNGNRMTRLYQYPIYGIPSSFLSDIESDSDDNQSDDYECGMMFDENDNTSTSTSTKFNNSIPNKCEKSKQITVEQKLELKLLTKTSNIKHQTKQNNAKPLK